MPRLIWVLALVVFLIGVSTLGLVFQYGRFRMNAARAQVRKDLRSFATAIESYCTDNAWYPSMTGNRALMESTEGVPSEVSYGPTFRRSMGRQTAFSLTTPIMYLTKACWDPFAVPYRVPYRYYVSPTHVWWMMASFGPDGDFLEGGNLPLLNDQMCDRFFSKTDYINPITPSLLAEVGPKGAYTYDPTNGLFSCGDIWRIKQ